MNELNIGETILKLRKERKLTQEELALMIGISAGAVSKWENGNSMPDISILAPLARALNTSIDTLLSFHKELSEEEVNNIKSKLTKLFLHEGYAVGEKECKRYLSEYPNSIYLKVEVAGLLNTYLMMSEDDSEEFVKAKRQEALDLFKKIAESKDPKYMQIALFFIAHINMILGNYEESERALNELPKSLDPVTLYPVILEKQGKKEEIQKFCSNKLLNYLNNSILMLIIMAKTSKKEKDYEKAMLYLDACHKIQDMFHIGLGSAAYKYVELYIEIGDKEAAAKWFKTYIEEVISMGYDYSSNPYFNKVELEIKPEEQKIIRKKMLKSIIDNEEFKILTGIKEYDMAIKEIEKAILSSFQ